MFYVCGDASANVVLKQAKALEFAEFSEAARGDAPTRARCGYTSYPLGPSTMKKPPAPSAPAAQFESALKELEEIVAKMEQGELALEESLQLFERGTQLSRQCRQALDTAELKIRNLLEGAEISNVKDDE